MTANKLTVACIEWKPRMFDVAIHVHPNGAGWAALPAKPQTERNGVVIKRDGKAQYVPVLAFTDRKTADAFSLRVIGAVLDLCPEAFDAAPVQ